MSAKAYERGRRALGDVADAVDDDPLLMSTLALALLSHANRRASIDACTPDEWRQRLHEVGVFAVTHIAAWNETPWSEALSLLGDRHEFTRAVLADIEELPE